MEETIGRKGGIELGARGLCIFGRPYKLSSQVETHLDRWCHKPLDPNDPSSLNPLEHAAVSLLERVWDHC